MKDQILFQKGNDWVITDVNGKQIHTLTSDPAHPILSVIQEASCYIVKYNDRIECYGKDFKLIASVNLDDPTGYFMLPLGTAVSVADEAAFSPILYCETEKEITFLDMTSGKTKTYSRSELPGNPARLPGSILVTDDHYDGSVSTFAILDDSDFHIISTGTGITSTIHDKATNRYYLFTREKYQQGKASVIDTKTGEALVEDVLNPEQTNLYVEIYNGKICYEAHPDFYDDDAATQHPFTVLTDKDGKIYFLNYAENGYAS